LEEQVSKYIFENMTYKPNETEFMYFKPFHIIVANLEIRIYRN